MHGSSQALSQQMPSTQKPVAHSLLFWRLSPSPSRQRPAPSQALGETQGFAKLLANEGDGQIVGGAVVGPRASELIAEVALAMQLGATVEPFAHTIRAHPTLAEVWTGAAEDWLGRCIHK